MIYSKTDVRLYASGWVVTHPGETRCDFERSFRTHGEAMEIASNHALACLHTLQRRREENRRLIAQAADLPDYMLGPSAHRDVVRVPASALAPARGGVLTNPEPIEISPEEIERIAAKARASRADMEQIVRKLEEQTRARPPLPAWSEIMPTGPIARIEPSLLDRLRAFGAEFGRAHVRLSIR